MKYDWRVIKEGTHTVVSLTVEAHGRRRQLDRAVESTHDITQEKQG